MKKQIRYERILTQMHKLWFLERNGGSKVNRIELRNCCVFSFTLKEFEIDMNGDGNVAIWDLKWLINFIGSLHLHEKWGMEWMYLKIYLWYCRGSIPRLDRFLVISHSFVRAWCRSNLSISIAHMMDEWEGLGLKTHPTNEP